MKNLDTIDSRWLEQVAGGNTPTRSTTVNSRLGSLPLGYGTGVGGLPLGVGGGLPLGLGLGGLGLGGLGNPLVAQAIADKKQQEQNMMLCCVVAATRR